MGELLDRGVQRELLEYFSASYPKTRPIQFRGDEPGRRVNVNLHYLTEHELLHGSGRQGAQGDGVWIGRITKDGLDFMAGDGGLTAILGVVTVRLHDDTIRQLIDKGIDGDEKASPEEKHAARQILGKLSGKALGTVVEELTKKSLEHFPGLVPYITHAGQVALRATGLLG